MGITDQEYDVVIVGAGMGGLACGNILAQEGKKVIVLEKNRQLGGNLQVFSRDKCVFDTGVHYLGGLDKGQCLYKLFRYFGIMDDLKLRRMDEDGFDRIHFGNEKVYYPYGMGYEKFKRNLYRQFPDEKKAIDDYCEAIQDVVNKLPLAKLEYSEEDEVLDIDFMLGAKEYIESLTSDSSLRKVLAGTNALYAGSAQTPFYVHALVLHYYIESSWQCIDGSSQIAKYMARRIKEFGGIVKNRTEVVSANYNKEGYVESVNLSDGSVIKGKNFISNIHPAVTMDLFGKEHFKGNYERRIRSLKNTGAMFVVHIVFHPGTFEFPNHNIFQLNLDDVWNLERYEDQSWPAYYMLSVPPNSKSEKYADGASVICGMSFDAVSKWAHTSNTVKNKKERGADYEKFKNDYAEKVIDAISIHYPDIRKKIKSYSCSTPLTQRDYTFSPNGSGYGIAKDKDAPFKTIVHPKTPVPNLFLTGQNLTLHGILGVSLTALLTCFHFTDKAALMQKIKIAAEN